MGTFIAKIRWDLAIKDVNNGRLVEVASVPTMRDPLHKVMVCARRYLHRVCERLSGGNMMVRRMLRKGSICSVLMVLTVEWKERRSFLILCKRRRVKMLMDKHSGNLYASISG